MKQFWTFLFVSIPAWALAHPGHGETEGFTIKHYMVEPEHAVVAVLALAITIFFLGRKKEVQQVQRKK